MLDYRSTSGEKDSFKRASGAYQVHIHFRTMKQATSSERNGIIMRSINPQRTAAVNAQISPSEPD